MAPAFGSVQDSTMDLEQTLTAIRTKAALLRYLASSAAINPEQLEPDTLAGFSDVCEEIEAMTRAVADTIGVAVLNVELKQRRR